MNRDFFKLLMQIFAGIIIVFLALKLFNINFSHTNLILKFGFGGLILSNLIYNLSKKEKRITDYIVVLHIFTLILLWIFIRYDLQNKNIMMLISGIVGLIWFLNIYRSILNFNDKNENLKNYLFITAAITIIVGALFQIQHWPLGKEMFYTGIGLGLISIIIEFLSWIKK